ncbi:MAG TPA: hypothetical protein VIR57_02295 [Chloroflexota bacterium]
MTLTRAPLALLVLLLASCASPPAATPNGPAPTLAPTTTTATPVGPASSYPDPARTPGDLNANVIQANIASTICVSGWTATVRPPASYTDHLKLQQLAGLGLAGPPTAYEEDHFVALELGGNPTSPRNLWPQPYAPMPGAHEKDRVENFLRRQVCSGALQLTAAQNAIRTDWVQVLRERGL